jgi:hypothetical protein
MWIGGFHPPYAGPEAADALAVIKLWAELQGRSVSDFVVAGAQEAAK